MTDFVNDEADQAFLQEILVVFQQESQDQLADIEAALLSLESNPSDIDLLSSVFRNVHTLKGSAGSLNFSKLEAFCHRVEAVLEPLRSGQASVSRTTSTLLLQCLDHIRRLIQLEADARPLDKTDRAVDRLLGLWLQSMMSSPQSPELAPSLASARSVSTPAPLKFLETPQADPMIRIKAAKLDSAINLVSELAAAGTAAEQAWKTGMNSELGAFIADIQQLVGSLHEDTLSMRMVPIGETFNRFRRMVHDLARELGKEVDLVMTGEQTEMDKSMVERIVDPLMHLLRNALDHGLESTQERLAQGKPEKGRLSLSASYVAGHVCIRVEDDGYGIKRQKVLERAIAQGLLGPQQAVTDEQLLRLIFEPSFSTAEAVTNISGRGFGMNVVKNNIDAMRGQLLVTSTEGQGTQIEIQLPLTLAIIDGFLVSSGAHKFVLPLGSVEEVMQPEVDRSAIKLRGELLPVFDLITLYSLGNAPQNRQSVVVVRANGTRYGISVDTLLGQTQCVIKPLGRLFQKVPGLSGFTILGNGGFALILQPQDLLDLASRKA